MSGLHLTAALVAAAAAVLYGHRSLWLARNGKQDTTWALANRGAWFFVPVGITGGFVELAVTDAPFEARHYFLTAVLLVVVVTHVGLRGKSPT